VLFLLVSGSPFSSVGPDFDVVFFRSEISASDMRARRSLEHSTIVYESPDLTPLLRLAWNKQDDYYLATFCMDSGKTIILDIRVPSSPAAELRCVPFPVLLPLPFL
jgi:hypothetical protein